MKRGFTLVELLVTITIIGILAAVSWGAIVVVRNSARVASTQATIIKLDTIIAEKWESYHTRRLPISSVWPNGGGLSEMAQVAIARFGWAPPDPIRPGWTNPNSEPGWPPPGTKDGQGRSLYWGPYWTGFVTLCARRDLMRMEMPERLTDIQQPPLFFPASYAGPGVYAAYRARYLDASGNARNPSLCPSAEMLYMIVAHTPEVYTRYKFGPSEIGDSDGNGHREFLDGWGHPIYFLRCAPGMPDSEVQIADPAEYHDPFDTRRFDSLAFRTIPMIYSAGNDGEYGLWQDFLPSHTPYGWSNTNFAPFLDPDLGVNVLMGSAISNTWADNIDNHHGMVR